MKHGTRRGIRTHSQEIKSLLLCQLSLAGKAGPEGFEPSVAGLESAGLPLTDVPSVPRDGITPRRPGLLPPGRNPGANPWSRTTYFRFSAGMPDHRLEGRCRIMTGFHGNAGRWPALPWKVETRGIEPPSPACKAGGIPFTYIPKSGQERGLLPTTMSPPLSRSLIYLGPSSGYDPDSPGSRPGALPLRKQGQERRGGIEPPTAPYKGASLPLAYCRTDRERGIEPRYSAWKAGTSPFGHSRIGTGVRNRT